MKINSELLRDAMREQGITVQKMCAEIGISRKAFWSKCKGRTEFRYSEIVKIVDMLGKDKGTAIFFAREVS